MRGGVRTENTRTGVEEVSIDGKTGLSPSSVSADAGPLTVQPVCDVSGVVKGAFGEDIVDIPVTHKRIKDIVVTVALSLGTVGVVSGLGTLEDLVSSQ